MGTSEVGPAACLEIVCQFPRYWLGLLWDERSSGDELTLDYVLRCPGNSNWNELSSFSKSRESLQGTRLRAASAGCLAEFPLARG